MKTSISKLLQRQRGADANLESSDVLEHAGTLNKREFSQLQQYCVSNSTGRVIKQNIVCQVFIAYCCYILKSVVYVLEKECEFLEEGAPS